MSDHRSSCQGAFRPSRFMAIMALMALHPEAGTDRPISSRSKTRTALESLDWRSRHLGFLLQAGLPTKFGRTAWKSGLDMHAAGSRTLTSGHSRGASGRGGNDSSSSRSGSSSSSSRRPPPLPTTPFACVALGVGGGGWWVGGGGVDNVQAASNSCSECP